MSDYSADIRPPSATTLSACAQLARENDMKIMLDYWDLSVSGQIFIGLRPDKTKLLFKNEQEYTSPITRVVQPTTDINEYIIMTENSIYLVYFENIRKSVKQIST